MTTEPPRPDQIQANVAAALSRLRGELAPTPPAATAAPVETPVGGPAAGGEPVAEAGAEHGLTSGEALFEVGPTLTAPDPSMALGHSKPAGEGVDTPFARMTGLKLSEQPDLLAGIGAPPLADISDAEAEAAKSRRRFRNRLLAGGVLVIALVGFWFWSGGGEPGNEPVPVITADSSPEKVKPADEGGLEVPNQDVAILNGESTGAPAEGETVLPAPEQPATPPVEAPATPETAPAADAGTAVPTVPAPAVDAIPSVPAPTVPAPGDVPSAAETAVPATAENAPAEGAPAADTQTAAAEAAPAEQAPAEAAPAAAPAAEPTVTGSARIQLAAVKSEAAAQKEWARIQKANPELLGGLTLHVERFNKTASEVYYRIQAGPLQDKASAKQLCAKLKQKNQACIVAN
ncbi:SPOR domain-containing protein [Dongia sp.]|uniref:SPOR domain-containing protein n=1 Tax=Dongia sp. TaxID=1977262 RepID=UPI0035AECA38